MLFLSLHHIALICSDYARSRAFCVGTFGLQVLHKEYRADRRSHKLSPV